jgi:hypothetical protein
VFSQKGHCAEEVSALAGCVVESFAFLLCDPFEAVPAVLAVQRHPVLPAQRVADGLSGVLPEVDDSGDGGVV